MELLDETSCVVGYSCRLPGGLNRPDALFDFFESGDWHVTSTPPPSSRGFDSYANIHGMQRGPTPPSYGRGGWLNEEGVEDFDPDFFHIPANEADTLRPNVRLALELTWEALEHAGIPPSHLRGKNVSVSFGVGTEDGWNMRRVMQDEGLAFNEYWAGSTDPSAISGRVSHFFDFRGSCSTTANACATGSFALQDGIRTLSSDDADVAIVGSVVTHFDPSSFAWAKASGVASARGRSSAFSRDADGYSPSEGAVVLVLKRYDAARQVGDVIYGRVRALLGGHNGATRTMFTPSATAQESLTRRALSSANLTPDDIDVYEAHGTGTPVGDALEVEAIRSVFGTKTTRSSPLFLSSSKTMLGHCHGTAALVGLLKVLTCFERRAVPPHRVTPKPEFLLGPIVIPTTTASLPDRRLLAQVNSSAFTGSITTFILESEAHTLRPPSPSQPPAPVVHIYFLPFSHCDASMLDEQIKRVCAWALRVQCSLSQLSAILGLCREHHPARRAILACSLEDLVRQCDTARLAASNFVMNYSAADPRLSLRIFEGCVQHPTPYEPEQLLREICSSYERGETLSFFNVYEKRDISRSLLFSFPFYLFNRRRCWKDIRPAALNSPHAVLSSNNLPREAQLATAPRPVTHNDSRTNTIANSEMENDMFLRFIEQFGAPLFEHAQMSLKSAFPVPSRSCVVLTGANGMLGARLLSLLIRMPGIVVCCLIRGDAWDRLTSAFDTHGLDCSHLGEARAHGTLRVLPTADLCAPQLGLSWHEYAWLRENVDQVVHAAWPVNFNLPLSQFEGILRCTRNLAELCTTATKKVRYFFIGTHASTYAYENDVVPESAMEPRLADALPQGYAIAKLVAEHALLRIAKSAPTAFELVIVRVGQICSDSTTGAWNKDEMVPMMIASLPHLRVLPIELPKVAWIPADTCAAVLRDFLLIPRAPREEPLILHVANPLVSKWSAIAHSIARIAGTNDFALVSLHEYTKSVRRHLSTSPVDVPIARLLPFFQSVVPNLANYHFPPLEVTRSRRLSAALDQCPPIEGRILEAIVRFALPPSSNQSPASPQESYIFTFGPAATRLDAVVPESDMMERVMDAAMDAGMFLASELDDDDLLHRQLKTLAIQLEAVEDLRSRGITPSVVSGYCFGEYAAAVTAGVFSLEVAVQILLRRARAVRDVNGALLNVFAELSMVKRILAHLVDPPAIAIIAGPTHIVLSGTAAQAQVAKNAFDKYQIKTLLARDQVPFHSPAVEAPCRELQIAQYTPTPQHKGVLFASSFVGSLLSPERVTAPYWKRHMRLSVDFFRAMSSALSAVPSAKIVDIGPGDMLKKMIARYGGEWKRVTVAGPAELQALPQPLHPPPPLSLPPSIVQEKLTSMPPSLVVKSKEPTDITSVLTTNKTVALALLGQILNYELTESLLSKSLHALGVQSLDFVRFSDRLAAKTGVEIPMSAYVSDRPLNELLGEDENA